MATVSKILLTGLVLMSLGFSVAGGGSSETGTGGVVLPKPKPDAITSAVTDPIKSYIQL